MSSSPGAGYKLRPNKAVDRELFLSFLSHFAASLDLKNYKYIGLGGAFLEDFRVIHARIGIKDMSCIDADEQVSKRQHFNKPINSIKCIHSTLEAYLDGTELSGPVILWLDYTDPSETRSQIEVFKNQLANLPNESILRITLNANPSSLGTPKREDLEALEPECQTDDPAEPTKLWRLKQFAGRLGDHAPTDLTFEDMSHKNYGLTILKTLNLVVEKTKLETNRNFLWCLATHYTDGQFMVTATIFVSDGNLDEIENLLRKWEFISDHSSPHMLNMPALSTLERLTLEFNPNHDFGYKLPKQKGMENPLTTFKKYYRVFPYFSRVEL